MVLGARDVVSTRKDDDVVVFLLASIIPSQAHKHIGTAHAICGWQLGNTANVAQTSSKPAARDARVSNRSAPLDEREHVLNAGALREGIASRISLAIWAGALGNLEHLDHAINQIGGSPLAAHGVPAKSLVGPSTFLSGAGRLVGRTGQNNAHRLRELSVGVGEELNQVRARKAHFLLPCRHDRAVVDADNPDAVDPCLLEAAVNLGSLEARDLARGSGGRERTRKGDEQMLALADKG
uniref:Uncharacterized protein n=1 Tax=Strombidinopsis acuminata TaxID=141414 RepID=A0A7S3RRX1_9SPIT|mmetsp:Transcript_22843/g.69920  ORF Transcript_22843/g.69920 Transcript_22843/m.69920 type:complete len:238 (+) Transcript_22843:178-891(+)